MLWRLRADGAFASVRSVRESSFVLGPTDGETR